VTKNLSIRWHLPAWARHIRMNYTTMFVRAVVSTSRSLQDLRTGLI